MLIYKEVVVSSCSILHKVVCLLLSKRCLSRFTITSRVLFCRVFEGKPCFFRWRYKQHWADLLDPAWNVQKSPSCLRCRPPDLFHFPELSMDHLIQRESFIIMVAMQNIFLAMGRIQQEESVAKPCLISRPLCRTGESLLESPRSLKGQIWMTRWTKRFARNWLKGLTALRRRMNEVLLWLNINHSWILDLATP